MSQNGYGAMVARKAHVGGGKMENGKRQTKRVNELRFGSGRRGMSLEQLRVAVIAEIPKRHKFLRADFDSAFRSRRKIPDAVFPFILEFESDPLRKAGLEYLRNLGKSKIKRSRQMAMA